MAITKKIQFINQEKTSSTSTTSTSYVSQGTLVDAAKLTAGNEYLVIAWVNSVSPSTNDGATKFGFSTSNDLVGSAYVRHDTNDSGTYVGYIGHCTAPDPTQDLQVFRKRVYGSQSETTRYGQGFLIDLSYAGASGGLISGIDFSNTRDISSNSFSTGGTMHTHTVHNSGGTQLVLATVRGYDSVNSVLYGLYINDVLVSSGSRYITDAADVKSVGFAGGYTMSSGDTIKLKNLDANTVTVDYRYIFTLNLDNAPEPMHTGQLSTWTNHGGSSGTWGTATVDGNNDNSFVVAMGRQTVIGAESGRMAAISLKNNTSNEYMLFGNRTTDFDPLYFPATSVGASSSQYETAVVVGTGVIGQADTIEMHTL